MIKRNQNARVCLRCRRRSASRTCASPRASTRSCNSPGSSRACVNVRSSTVSNQAVFPDKPTAAVFHSVFWINRLLQCFTVFFVGVCVLVLELSIWQDTKTSAMHGWRWLYVIHTHAAVVSYDKHGTGDLAEVIRIFRQFWLHSMLKSNVHSS